MDVTEKARIGDSDVEVTRLGLGTGMLGAVHDDATWKATFQAAWDAGIRLYDTSPFYGFGNSEIRIGRLLSGHDPTEYVLGTKVGRLLRLDAEVEYFAATTYYPELGGEMPDGVPRGKYDYSRTGTLQSLLETTWRLGRRQLDIVYVHDILELSSGINHAQTAIEEAYPVLAEQKAAGNIRAVGIGVQDLDVLTEIVSVCDLDVVLLAGRYTLLDQSSLDRALPMCHERGVSVVIGSPFNTGLLRDPAPDKTFDFVKAPPEMVERARALKTICGKHDVPLPAAAIQFPFAHPAVAAVLTGATAPHEVKENVEFISMDIPDALWRDLRDSGLLNADAPVPGEL